MSPTCSTVVVARDAEALIDVRRLRSLPRLAAALAGHRLGRIGARRRGKGAEARES